MMTLLHESTDGTLYAKKDGAVGHIVFNNQAKRNAVTLAGWASLGEAIAAIDNDDEVRVVVISGAGTATFISGSDISEFSAKRSEAEAIRHYNDVSDASIARLAAARRPLIAAIRGYCLGGGLAIALCCDMRVAAATAVFGIPAARVGLAYRYTGIARFLAAVGPANTNEIFMTARRYPAREALQMGLVNRVVPDDALDATIAELCEQVANNAPLTIEAVKAAVRELTKPIGEPDASLMEQFANRCFASEDYAEGRAAFMAKRKPNFKGR